MQTLHKKTAKLSRLLLIYEKDEGRCHYCYKDLNFGEYGGDIGWTLDHVMPKKLGGKNTPDNLVAACNFCNSIKGHLTVEAFREKLRMMIEANRSFNKRFQAFVNEVLE